MNENKEFFKDNKKKRQIKAMANNKKKQKRCTTKMAG